MENDIKNIVSLLVSKGKDNRVLGATIAMNGNYNNQQLSEIWEGYLRHTFNNSIVYSLFFTTGGTSVDSHADFGIYTQRSAKPIHSFQRHTNAPFSRQAWRCQYTLRVVVEGVYYLTTVRFYVDFYKKKYNVYINDPGDKPWPIEDITYSVEKGRKQLIVSQALKEGLNIFLV